MSEAKKLIGLVTAVITFSACTQKIDLPLKDATPVVMIEGNISDRTDIPALVLISQTTSYTDTSFFHGLSGAIVTVNDGTQTNTLTEVNISGVPAGTYANFSLRVQAGKTYTLSVQLNGKTYLATSQTTSPIAIDSLSMAETVFSHDPRISCNFRDPAGVNNYYKADLWINGKFQSQVNISNDNLTDGTQKHINLDATNCQTGDTIDVFLESIDENVYNYFYTLDNASASSAAPANPTSNISGGCLGYFSAYTTSHQQMIYP